MEKKTKSTPSKLKIQTCHHQENQKTKPNSPRREKPNGSQNLTSNLDMGVPIWFLSGVSMSREETPSHTSTAPTILSLSLTLYLSLCTFCNFPSLFHDFVCLSLSLSVCVQTKQMGYSIEDERMRFKKKREGGSGSRFSRGDNLTLPPHPTHTLTHTHSQSSFVYYYGKGLYINYS